MKKIIISAAMVALSATAAHAASGNTANATGSATAIIVSPIRITHNAGASLNFGTVTAGTGGTVVVSQAGGGSVTGDVGTVAGNSNSADAFTVTGDLIRAFNISTSTGNTVSTGGALPSTMAFSLSAPSTGALLLGTYALNVGGTLTVGAAQAAGSYSGSYTVTVTYQ
ncbi:DUF4402 domain-containing protein [Novosphingobium lentum]|uniref:DUF4402 domain-containing protein n=1 Tax=Novosphingobium lentum TaxID=145287 RepID=UPI00083049E9|nr:DUF4402 domain-containing protein [Novosphingobium lentum]